jgi:hypothetical protein
LSYGEVGQPGHNSSREENLLDLRLMLQHNDNSAQQQEEKNIRKTEVKERKEGGENCSVKTDVVFAKTHKTGSTTVQNILFRFGEKRKLAFVLPKVGDKLHHYLFYYRSR